MKNQLELIQKTEMNILKEFIRICQKHNIKYFLAEGTMLGAVRHKGMIPWDDDIDVALFREDYEKFLQVVDSEIKAPYKCRHYTTDSSYKDYIAQLVDTSTLIESHYRRTKEVKPLWIDIFVIDGMPDGSFAKKVRKFHLLARKLMLMWSDLNHYVVPRSNRPLYEKVLIFIGDKLHTSKFLSTSKQLGKMDHCMKACKAKKDGMTVSFMSEYKWRTVFPAEFYGEGREVEFEDITAIIPEKSEQMLASIYGDYMKLPPEDQRYKHNITMVKIGENSI